MGNDEVDQFLTLKPTRPQVVTLALDNHELHLAPQLGISLLDLPGILVQGNCRVTVSMDMEDGTSVSGGGIRKAVRSSIVNTSPWMGSLFSAGCTELPAATQTPEMTVQHKTSEIRLIT